MAERKYAVALATPTLTRGDELPPTPCALKPEPFDVLSDSTAGGAYRTAVVEAKALCDACDIRTTCHAENKGQQWVRAILTQGTRQQPTKTRSCGKTSGHEAHRKRNEWPCVECTKALKAYQKARRAA